MHMSREACANKSAEENASMFIAKKKTVIVSFVPIIAIIKYRVFFLNAKSLGTFSRRMITLTLLFPCLLHTQPWNTLEYYCSLQ